MNEKDKEVEDTGDSASHTEEPILSEEEIKSLDDMLPTEEDVKKLLDTFPCNDDFKLSDVGKAKHLLKELNNAVVGLTENGLRVYFDEYTHMSMYGNTPQFRLAVYKEVHD